MPQHHRLVDLSLAEPRAFLPGGEDLNGHLLPAPLAPPHLAEAPLPDALLEDDGPGNGPLDQQRQAWGDKTFQNVAMGKASCVSASLRKSK